MRTLSAVFRELRGLRSLQAEPRLLRFRISRPDGRTRIDFMGAVDGVAGFRPEGNLVMFIHGVDYANEGEAVSDFVGPVADACGLGASRRQADFYLLAWNSVLVSSLARSLIGVSVVRRLKFFLAASLWWSCFWRDAERRAGDAAAFLVPYLEKCFGEGIVPTAITHSAGSLVWAGALTRMAAKHPPDFFTRHQIGRWWNLQPAIPYGSFCVGGEYAQVAGLYASDRPRHLVWFSRMDFILAAMYRLARKVPALGQFGSRNPHVHQRDVTWVVWEAHGTNTLFRASGCFFARARSAMRVDARILGLL
ncbi:MAG: hypothetical protein RIQ81_2665 [Pseudomonadota bacterium]|jgi:hypothetical protein